MRQARKDGARALAGAPGPEGCVGEQAQIPPGILEYSIEALSVAPQPVPPPPPPRPLLLISARLAAGGVCELRREARYESHAEEDVPVRISEQRDHSADCAGEAGAPNGGHAALPGALLCDPWGKRRNAEVGGCGTDEGAAVLAVTGGCRVVVAHSGSPCERKVFASG